MSHLLAAISDHHAIKFIGLNTHHSKASHVHLNKSANSGLSLIVISAALLTISCITSSAHSSNDAPACFFAILPSIPQNHFLVASSVRLFIKAFFKFLDAVVSTHPNNLSSHTSTAQFITHTTLDIHEAWS
jgi:hypothetical protein